MSQAEPRSGALCLTLQQLGSTPSCPYTTSHCSAWLLPPLTLYCRTGGLASLQTSPLQPLLSTGRCHWLLAPAAAWGSLQTASNHLSETAWVCFIPNLHHERGLRSIPHRLLDYLMTKPKAKQLHFQREKRMKKKTNQEPPREPPHPDIAALTQSCS